MTALTSEKSATLVHPQGSMETCIGNMEVSQDVTTFNYTNQIKTMIVTSRCIIITFQKRQQYHLNQNIMSFTLAFFIQHSQNLPSCFSVFVCPYLELHFFPPIMVCIPDISQVIKMQNNDCIQDALEAFQMTNLWFRMRIYILHLTMKFYQLTLIFLS